MSNFVLDSRLSNDCFVLGRLGLCQLLLMNNAALPWYILVPETRKIELYELGVDKQALLLEEINLISRYVKENHEGTKLNIAEIGNIVSQMHIHIVGRHSDDYCWPGVVWGTTSNKTYDTDQVEEIVAMVQVQLGSRFTVL